MTQDNANIIFEKDDTDRIIDLCRQVKDKYVRQIVLGCDFFTDTNYDNEYEKELKTLEKHLRKDAIYREAMFNRVVNLAFAYLVSKYTALNLTAMSNCESRIKHTVENLYNTYNVTDDVVRFVFLNIALGLDANKSFRNKFDVISHHTEFYKNTDEYINIFKHIQKLRQSSFKTRGKIADSNYYLYLLCKKLSFICDLEIVESKEYGDEKSGITPCSFKIDNNIYPSKYALAKYVNQYNNTTFLFLRSIEELSFPNDREILRLNYTPLNGIDTAEVVKVVVVPEVKDDKDRDKKIETKSIGMFYSYITGDLLRKRHRKSFCNGLANYKYYGELAASVMDALEMSVIASDKQNTVVENYILPVIKNNFDICKGDCVCTGIGCKYNAKERPCNKDKIIEFKNELRADCVSHMDIISILTILFSVVGCKEILPQIFAKFVFLNSHSYDELFSKVNEQLKKRFSDFKPEEVEAFRREFYNASIDYLSLNLDDSDEDDSVVALTLKPFKIRAYTDALVYCLENLDKDKSQHVVNPSGNVYSIQSRIDLISGLSSIVDVRSTLRDALKIILTYYYGLAKCTQEQLNYEVQAGQMSLLSPKMIAECRNAIESAFMNGAKKKLEKLDQNPSFYTLFSDLIKDAKKLKSEISIMLGREMVSTRALQRYIYLDEANERCYLVEKKRKDNGEWENIYQCDLDDESQCRGEQQKFVARVTELLRFFKGDDVGGVKFSCYPQVLTHTSSRVNVDNTTINTFTVYESEQYLPKKEYNVITFFSYEINKRYFYVAPKKFEKTRWITYPILISCSKFYDAVVKEGV
ncbi:MAG: hypothetical protein NC037_05300 [Bacteroides sp.]|nr:hypothetical protein [Bacillota bacterium]MCM1394185.1 hypothetical protein [[Eubacterium] siraeum]MCM1455922.1 hypothetical protein [Bacteroides sp.]